jgi:hypothetical protein
LPTPLKRIDEDLIAHAALEEKRWS